MWTIIIGILAGFLAGILIKGRGFGCFGNLLVGIVGSFLGSLIFDLLQISVNQGNKIGALTMSTVGAVALLLLVSIFNKK